jgi:hypothetical protein
MRRKAGELEREGKEVSDILGVIKTKYVDQKPYSAVKIPVYSLFFTFFYKI